MKRLSGEFYKKRYFDARAGYTTVSPIIAILNFILISYNFSIMKEYMNIITFTILVGLGLIVALTMIGVVFRRNQYKVDLAFSYFENKEQLKTDLLILDSLVRFYLPTDSKSIKINDRIKILKAHLGVT